jgi:hypothetical protein
VLTDALWVPLLGASRVVEKAVGMVVLLVVCWVVSWVV